jgi:hypothetical protein
MLRFFPLTLLDRRKTVDKIPDGKEKLVTSTVCTNHAALHVRFFDPVSDSYKETVAIVSPKVRDSLATSFCLFG